MNVVLTSDHWQGGPTTFLPAAAFWLQVPVVPSLRALPTPMLLIYVECGSSVNYLYLQNGDTMILIAPWRVK